MGFFAAIRTGWRLTKLSFSMLMEEKKLILFPLISGIASIMLLVGFIAPFLITGMISTVNEAAANILMYAVLFAFYMATSFVAIFFNVALVHSLKSRIEGNAESMGSSISFAMSKFGTILVWSIISAIVGMILNAIESSARKAKGVGGLLLLLLKGLLGLAWTVLTFFVIPIIVYQDLGVVDTIKKSGETIKKTWGEALMVNFSAGFVFGILIVLWLIVGFVLMAGLATVQPLLALVVLLLIIFGLVMIMLIQATVTSIYKTLLYLYAEQGVVPPGFSESEMQGMFRK